MKKILILLILLTLILSNCDILGKESYDAILYYPYKDGTGYGEEIKTIEYNSREGKIKETIEALLNGPQDEESYLSIGEKRIKLKGTVIDNTHIEINFDKQFDEIMEEAEKNKIIYCIVSTLLQYRDIENVKLLVEGGELLNSNNEPYGFFNEEKLNIFQLEKVLVTLYFADSQGIYVVPEKRELTLNKNIDKEGIAKAILIELIKGPIGDNIFATIPEDVKVLDLEVAEDLIYVDFSAEMHRNHWGGAAGENMTLTSLVNTLTEIEGIKRVLPSVEGRALNIEHAIIEEPLLRDEGTILH